MEEAEEEGEEGGGDAQEEGEGEEVEEGIPGGGWPVDDGK